MMHNAKKLLESDDSEIPIGLLFSMIHRRHMIFINEKVRDMDLTAGQIPFLMVLSREEGITQDELAAHFYLDKGTVARALRKLEDNDYVLRTIDPKNRRRHIISITEKAKATIPQIKDIDREWETSICSKVSTEEYGVIINILKKMACSCLENAEKSGERNEFNK